MVGNDDFLSIVVDVLRPSQSHVDVQHRTNVAQETLDRGQVHLIADRERETHQRIGD